MTGPSLIDRAVLDDLFDYIGADGARSVLTLFVGESRATLAMIAEAAALPGDPGCRERARRAAHSLKSSAGQIGGVVMAGLAEAVERAAADGAPDLAPAAAALCRCAEATMQALRPFLA